MKRRKLNAYEVVEIHTLLAAGVTQAAIAKEYGVTQRTISSIARGETWALLQPALEPAPDVEPKCIVLPDTGEVTGDYAIWPDGRIISWKAKEPIIVKPQILPSGNPRVILRCYDRRRSYMVDDLVQSTWGTA